MVSILVFYMFLTFQRSAATLQSRKVHLEHLHNAIDIHNYTHINIPYILGKIIKKYYFFVLCYTVTVTYTLQRQSFPMDSVSSFSSPALSQPRSTQHTRASARQMMHYKNYPECTD
jgi:hypothetical protein